MDIEELIRTVWDGDNELSGPERQQIEDALRFKVEKETPFPVTAVNNTYSERRVLLCSACGQKVGKSDRYCKQCGRKLVHNS